MVLTLTACVGALNGEQKTANGKYLATAYNQRGLTASGVPAQSHVVAADPDILPIGTRIKIRHAGRYSGEYVVADTGEKIEGRHVDIFIPNQAACRKFGKKTVRIQVVQLGAGTREDTKQAQHAVKEDVKQDLAKKVVGNAATEADWAARKSIQKSSAADAKSSGASTAAAPGDSAAGSSGAAQSQAPSGTTPK